MKYEQKVHIETSEYICLVKRIDGVVAQKTLEQELIRCVDCKWYDTTRSSRVADRVGYRCKLVTNLWKEPDDHCKYAKKRKEE